MPILYTKRKPASIAAKELNATVFEDHHLRVDHVSHPAPKDNKELFLLVTWILKKKKKLCGNISIVNLIRMLSL